MKRIVSIAAFLIIALIAGASEQEQAELFRQANTAYDSGNYEESVALYNTIVDNGYDSWELRYNLGNAHYRLDNIGLSILNYERALRMAPGKKVIKENLALARSHTTDNIEELPHLFLKDWAWKVAQTMTLRGWLILIAILVIIGLAATSIFLITKEYTTRKRIFIADMILLVMLLFCVGGATISAHIATRDNEAIIMEPMVVVKGSPDAKSVDKFVLHEGTKVTIQDVNDEWWQIEIADGKSGWIDGGAEII